MLEEKDGMYQGNYENYYFHGEGTMNYENNNNSFKVFVGTWYKGRLEEGIMEFTDGRSYKGKWSGNKFDIKGKLEDKHIGKFVYEGGFELGEKNGEGNLNCQNGDYFHGIWEKGVFVKGKARRTDEHQDKTKDVYEGSIEGGQLSGEGKMTYKNGDEYHGEWKVGKYHGNGKKTFKAGNKDNHESYDGSWENGVFSGQGTLMFKNGDSYVGKFSNGEFSDDKEGSFKWKNGDYQKGEWDNGKLKKGFGKITDSHGNSFEGNWKDGKYDEGGTFTYKNGEVLKPLKNAGWENGLKNGKFELTKPNGDKVVKFYKDDNEIN
jgi:hypothetical protein